MPQGAERWHRDRAGDHITCCVPSRAGYISSVGGVQIGDREPRVDLGAVRGESRVIERDFEFSRPDARWNSYLVIAIVRAEAPKKRLYRDRGIRCDQA